jgi:hypothetical protein
MPERRTVRLAIVNTLSFQADVAGSRLLAVDAASALTETRLLLPDGMERVRIDGAGYLTAGPISDAEQAAILAVIAPHLRVAAVDTITGDVLMPRSR